MQTYETLIAGIKERFPVYATLLNPGASEEAIQHFLHETVLEIPESVPALYRIADGSLPYATVDVEGMTFFSLERILRSKQLFDEIQAEKKAEGAFFCWHTDWVPFADDFSYDTLAIDTSGKATGFKGCIISRPKDSFEEDQLCLIAPDFDTFVREWIARVENEEVYRQGAPDSAEDNWPEDHQDYSHPHWKFVDKLE